MLFQSSMSIVFFQAYKTPSALDIPVDFRIELQKGVPSVEGVLGSKSKLYRLILSIPITKILFQEEHIRLRHHCRVHIRGNCNKLREHSFQCIFINNYDTDIVF